MKATNQATPRIVAVNVIAGMLGVSHWAVKRLVATGRLRTVTRSSGALVIPFEEVGRLLAEPDEFKAPEDIKLLFEELNDVKAAK
jgi:hypothetical protein